jgi:hypothetical protein
VDGKKFWRGKVLALSEYLGLIERNESEFSQGSEGQEYTREAESLGNFLINSVPDGRGVFIFDPSLTTLPQWSFTKVAGLTSYKEDISLLYRSIDYSMLLGSENMLSLLIAPLAEDGSFNTAGTFVLAYRVFGLNVTPYTEKESNRVKAEIASVKHTSFKTGNQWMFDPKHVPACHTVAGTSR